jgi:hypothetical protein
MRLNSGPLDIVQNAPRQGCSRLFATMNKTSGDLKIPNVNSA